MNTIDDLEKMQEEWSISYGGANQKVPQKELKDFWNFLKPHLIALLANEEIKYKSICAGIESMERQLESAAKALAEKDEKIKVLQTDLDAAVENCRLLIETTSEEIFKAGRKSSNKKNSQTGRWEIPNLRRISQIKTEHKMKRKVIILTHAEYSILWQMLKYGKRSYGREETEKSALEKFNSPIAINAKDKFNTKSLLGEIETSLKEGREEAIGFYRFLVDSKISVINHDLLEFPKNDHVATVMKIEDVFDSLYLQSKSNQIKDSV